MGGGEYICGALLVVGWERRLGSSGGVDAVGERGKGWCWGR